MVDAAAGGSFAQKTLEEARQLIEVMASNNYNHRKRNSSKRGVLELNTLDALLAQNKLMSQQLHSLNAKLENMKFERNKLVHYVALTSQEEYHKGTMENPKELCQAIITRSGKVIEPQPKKKPLEKDDDLIVGQEEEVAEQQPKPELEIAKEEEEEKIPPKQKLVVDEAYWNRSKKQILEDSCKPQIPPPIKLHINILFAEALEQMPLYAKFMKDLLSKKMKLKEDATIALTEECNAILQQKLPPKLKDLGSFTIPCTIGNVTTRKALWDLGDSINLISLSILKKLGVGEVKSTKMALQLADRSIKYPYGVMEDVLVKVEKLIFSANIVILDIDEDSEVLAILGRPFLATGRALIDVQ
ncbi:uncharacterized protein LOC113862096 [Abrus precatorius]|uniref:Uncharacterized protein LOC113862096 n=1 Tax=Abrus precatorius TaxID=3816 RepID=A0A8B8L422_ABRPR|nr:uncharacterized protein LOC113862096 [Abrus precatorius]